MSLRKCLESLPGDADTGRAVDELLRMFQRRRGEWLSVDQVLSTVESPRYVALRVLGQLVDGSVLSMDDDDGKYRYAPDSLLRMEVDSHLRRIGTRAGMLQNNVARFRDRYGR